MIRHYLASAFANIARTPFTTAANILTLALGLACFIAAWGVATYWRSADGYHESTRRTLVIGQTNTPMGQDPVPMHSMSSWTLARYITQDFPEIEHVARAFAVADVPVAAGESKALLNQAVVDPDFLRIFDLAFIAGDPTRALAAPNSVVLTEEAARRLFPNGAALGRPLIINGKDEATVTGVIAPVRQPSFMGAGPDAVLRFDMLHDWASHSEGAQLDSLESWLGLRPFTFVSLSPGLSQEAFNRRLPGFLDRRLPATDKAAARTTLHAFPVSELTTFDLDRVLFAGNGIGLSTIGSLLALAALTLAIACVNYANLATAQAATRAREIGMRRVLGAGALRVMSQVWLEAMISTAAAALVAIAVLVLAAPAFHASTSIDLLYFLARPEGLAVLFGIVALVAFIAGLYPALILSRVRPSVALQSGRSRSGSRRIAGLLVAVQFASAGFLLILLTVTQLQRGHLEQVALAPLEDPVAVLNDLRPIGVDYDTLAARLKAAPGVKAVSVVDMQPWGESYNGMTFARDRNAGAGAPTAMVRSVGHDYFDVLDLDVLAGRVFDRARDNAPSSLYAFRQPGTPSMVIDRRYAEALGFPSPQAAVGQTVYVPAALTRRAAQPVEIIGVVESEATRLEDTGAGAVYSFATKAFWGQQRPIVRIDRNEVSAAIAGITGVWNELAPNVPADIRFFDQLFEQTYRQYWRITELFILLALTAFFIASVGLIGIAVHVASRRRHEIAIRKTLGSSVLLVVKLLLTDFSIPVLIGNLLAWPVAYLAAQTYLAAFAYRIDLTPAPFILSMLITLLIAWAAVIGVVLKAASVRPAEVLRHA